MPLDSFVEAHYTAVTPSALRRRAFRPSTPKMLLRVYMALRGSDSHEASKPLQIFFLKEWVGSRIKLKPQSG